MSIHEAAAIIREWLGAHYEWAVPVICDRGKRERLGDTFAQQADAAMHNSWTARRAGRRKDSLGWVEEAQRLRRLSWAFFTFGVEEYVFAQA